MNWDEFLKSCIMMGCDYLKSVDRIGLKTLLKDYKKQGSCKKVIQSWLENKTLREKVPKNYSEHLIKASYIFKF